MALPARFRRPRYLVLIAAIVLLVSRPRRVVSVSTASAARPSWRSPSSCSVSSPAAVAKVTFDDRSLIDVAFRDGSVATTIAPPDFLAANPSFVTDLVKRQIRVEGARRRRIPPRSAGPRWPPRPPSSPCSHSPFIARPPGKIPSISGARARRRARRQRRHVPGRRGRRRSQGRSQGNRRFPPRAAAILRGRRPDPEGRAARRPAGNRQDAAGALDRG